MKQDQDHEEFVSDSFHLKRNAAKRTNVFLCHFSIIVGILCLIFLDIFPVKLFKIEYKWCYMVLRVDAVKEINQTQGERTMETFWQTTHPNYECLYLHQCQTYSQQTKNGKLLTKRKRTGNRGHSLV